ncbi:H/ACA ribonucleoprotein complex non-core subunit NAF1 [Striga asiatica]|uniref:H/ACA ribonucleoprotein complex non-core subunit NAF1 n=1 Tax=Striga asiatica TaxID=4170 RepID=A0A5A7PH58_STRAF|nr:H/ACA ribonucleoprotein complex non-core subunit NAF1 [Striga asiatica]
MLNMVGFLQSPAADGAITEEKEGINKSTVSADTKKPEDPCKPELEDVPSSFPDSFLDLDSISGWLLGVSPDISGDPVMAGLGGDPLDFASCIDELGNPEGCSKTPGDEIVEKGEGIEKSLEKGHEGGVKLGVLIEEQLGKVSLGESSLMDGGEKAKLENEANGDENESEGGASSSSSSSASSSDGDSSSSSCSSDDEDGNGEKKVMGRLEVEEGEIVLADDVDEMVAWSDNEDGMVGPILSKNELKVLPPVPPINVTLEPHHETLPVGVILSVVGAQVIVEGLEKHNPLNEGSILWVTETRLPLGIIDEIFGPVKNPYYIVRYNSESEVPAGIELGTLISFVEEFANHVLNDKSLYQKGYDASGENDEELSDELEFSDDEKEAEYRKMLKMKKRGNDGPKPVNKRKENRKQKKKQNGSPQTQLSGGDTIQANREQHLVGPPPISTSLNQENVSFSLGPNRDLASFQSQGPPGLGPPNVIWNNNGFPLQNGLPGNGGMLWMQQNGPFQFFQTPPLQTNMAFQQQVGPMGPLPGLPFNFNGLGGQTNFVGGPMIVPPPSLPGMSMGQNMLNPAQFGIGLQTQQASGPMNGGEQNGQNPQQSTESLNFSQGRGGGRRGQYRGGRGRFGGGRGRFNNRQNG